MPEDKERGTGSRILRERAMKTMRETRAKIDPRLLEAMKERLSPASVPSKPVYPAEALRPATPESEAVDKEKIAQIVMNYMKNREEKNRH
jgi:hypothetical protein